MKIPARYEKYLSSLFFIGGFIFDLCLLDRIDSMTHIIQQAAYLLVLSWMLWSMLNEERIHISDVKPVSKLRKLWLDYRLELLHFLFGGLMSAYTIFYFKSSSLIVSFSFMLFIVALFIANESHYFRSLGLPFKFALLALCYFSYFAYVIPILMRSMGPLVFLFSLLVGFLPFAFAAWRAQRKSALMFELVKSNVVLPAALVLCGFLIAYVFKVIPPVPLSIPFIGVYHSVEKTNGHYKLGDENPWWRFWNEGDQHFEAQPQDKVYVYFRLFSPTNFSDNVNLNWYHKDSQYGWQREDQIPIQIFGGREQGFRGYGFKSNYQPGQWMVSVATEDGLEIGRIHFNLTLTPKQPRALHYEIQ